MIVAPAIHGYARYQERSISRSGSRDPSSATTARTPHSRKASATRSLARNRSSAPLRAMTWGFSCLIANAPPRVSSFQSRWLNPPGTVTRALRGVPSANARQSESAVATGRAIAELSHDGCVGTPWEPAFSVHVQPEVDQFGLARQRPQIASPRGTIESVHPDGNPKRPRPCAIGVAPTRPKGTRWVVRSVRRSKLVEILVATTSVTLPAVRPGALAPS